jgi:hypothetical protein
VLVLIGIVLAYLVAYPVFALTYAELRRYPRHMWSGYGNPYTWRQATIVSYACFGLPVLVVTLVWRTSTTRAELRGLADRTRLVDHPRDRVA